MHRQRSRVILKEHEIPTIEERVAFIEGQMSEQSHALLDLRDSVRNLQDAVRHLDQKVDGRFDLVERRFEAVDRRFESMDDKISRQFVWLVGVQVTTLVAIVGALLARG
jgi:hypothetical protein